MTPPLICQLMFLCGSPYLSKGLFVRCLNLLALIVAARRQEHEDCIFIRTWIRNQSSINQSLSFTTSPPAWQLLTASNKERTSWIQTAFQGKRQTGWRNIKLVQGNNGTKPCWSRMTALNIDRGEVWPWLLSSEFLVTHEIKRMFPIYSYSKSTNLTGRR